jgi:predicted O-methyltransferase YrrM
MKHMPTATAIPVKKKRGRPRKSPLLNKEEQSPPAAASLKGEAGVKLETNQPSPAPKKSKPQFPTDPEELWQAAHELSQSIIPHYSLYETEQKIAFHCSLALEKGATIVELGVTHGRTGCLLAYAAMARGAKYYGIDNFSLEGNPHQTRSFFDERNLKYNLIVGNTSEVAWDKPIDMILFDAGHDELNMRQDTTRWLPYVKPGGLALFHAYNKDIDFTDPHWPVKRWADEYTRNWEEIFYLPSLMVRRKPLHR